LEPLVRSLTISLQFSNTIKNLVSFFAVIWTSQGSFLTENSTKDTLDRNTGIFWAIFQGSLLFGNLFVFFEFQGVTEIKSSTRTLTYTVFSSVCGVGTVLLLFLRPVARAPSNDSNESDSGVIEDSSGTLPGNSSPTQLWEQVHGCFRLLRTVRMQFLVLIFVYSGAAAIELHFIQIN
jgi:hypothetical protein